MGRVIAIDGPSGAGKSTISRLLAERLGFEYLDTGALYRAVALRLVAKGLAADSPDEEIEQTLRDVVVSFRDSAVYLDGSDVSEDIRRPEVGNAASVFSARGVVRRFLLDIQRNMAEHHDIVAEGRDMTTVVFPGAWKKFFLDASEEIRARRRYLQLSGKQKGITMDAAFRDIRDRDERDKNRDIAPLKRADDAIYIDSTTMSPEETIRRITEELAVSQSS